MNEKFDAFVIALRALCHEHGVQLSSSGYDLLEVWDLTPSSDPLYAPLVDMTHATPKESEKLK
jgi:hypothetical protein